MNLSPTLTSQLFLVPRALLILLIALPATLPALQAFNLFLLALIYFRGGLSPKVAFAIACAAFCLLFYFFAPTLFFQGALFTSLSAFTLTLFIDHQE